MKILYTLFSLCILHTPLLYSQQPYYDDVDLTKTKDELFEELANKVKNTHVNFLSYTPGIWEASKKTDIDPINPEEVILIYGFEDGNDTTINNDRTRDKDRNGGGNGEWNREHTYPRSLGNPNLGSEGPGSDAHHLRPSDIQRNANRGNRKFAVGQGSSGTTSQGFWYPGDEWKGDVARMMLYMYLRYGDRCLPKNVAIGTENPFDENMIDLLLDWNTEDPVSLLEDNRNTYHDSNATYAQGNRNPFIDNPYLATLIWGGTPAQDRWNLMTDDTIAPSVPQNLKAVIIEATQVSLQWEASTDENGVFKYNVHSEGKIISTSGTTSTTLQNLQENTEYIFSVSAEDQAGNQSDKSDSIKVTTRFEDILLLNEDFNDCNTVARNFIIYSEASDKDWFCSDTRGLDDSGAYAINGFRQDEPSRDWLITKNGFDFKNIQEPKISFFLKYQFGNTPLEFLYSTTYNGDGDPTNYEWKSIPNVKLPSDFSQSEQTMQVDQVAISEITGDKTYFAFRYYSTEAPTRYFLDNFKLSSTNVLSTSFVLNPQSDVMVVYSNPKDTLTSIQIKKKISDFNVFNVRGEKVFSKNTLQKGRISLPNLTKGLYFIHGKHKNTKIYQKFIIN
ncbi:endonuclease [Aquimarina sp. ERC-38]|uniref:endonuclease n=1 Tax=Aquimarina sp. ERC-38 TaxID=2949996 RepID=UPI0022478DB2|nr:endonuclease [Aquimarina sp. ERC-38]UZO80897.1 endonuclease [Aquimarina sp. ERC-38]